MKSTEELLSAGESLLSGLTQNIIRPEENRANIEVVPDYLVEAVRILVDNGWGYLMTITGKDIPPVHGEDGQVLATGMIMGLYHFANESAIISLQVQVPYENPIIPSICSVIPSATIYEREFMELFGVQLEGTPDHSRLVLPDDWPDGVYPLRKSFTSLQEIAVVGKEVE